MSSSWSALAQDIDDIATEWRSNRADRQARRGLDPGDFERLATAGFLRVAVPEEMGGLWRNVAETTRPICEVLRTLAAADPSVALVSSMHPAVLGFWLATTDPSRAAWNEQREAVFVPPPEVNSGARSRPSRAAAATFSGPRLGRYPMMGPNALCRAVPTASAATNTSAAVRE